jgi:D-glycero-D-manno-heptose 1,7-bisphosphate phosphatase
MDSLKRAVFLDRDGTVIEDVDYLSDPAGVRLLPGAAEAVAELRAAGLFVVLVTNQSGIGRGYFSEDDYRAVHARLREVLAERGARLDAAYHAPDARDGGPDADRKPGAGMYLRAAREHGIDLAASFYVGDRMRDVLAARRFGGRALLVRGEKTEMDQAEADPSITVVASLAEAARVILAEMPTRG